MASKHPSAAPRPSVFPYRTCEMARASLALVATVLAVGLAVLLCLALVLPQAIRPARGASPAPVAPQDEAPVAGLFFKSGRDDALFEAPVLKSDVRIDVNGEVARVTVRQRFANPSTVWLEGVYAFSLPERSAVDRLAMTVGERRIEGRIMEREQARKVYDEAARQGRRASLLHSERPNVFVTSVANVGPGDEIVVESSTRSGWPALRLVTCYPFDALLPGGPLRYLVYAEEVSRAAAPPETASTAPVRSGW